MTDENEETQDAVKMGAMISAANKKKAQAMHDYAKELGAVCDETAAVKGWVTINGAHILIGEDGEPAEGFVLNKDGGGSGQGKGWSSPREEFKFVERRLNAGGLKKGERLMLERRREKLAKQALGVND